MRIAYRDMVAGGMLRQVPLSSVATVQYANTYGGILRLNQKRVITLASNVLEGYKPNEVVEAVTNAILLKPTIRVKQVTQQLSIFEAEEIEIEKNKDV